MAKAKSKRKQKPAVYKPAMNRLARNAKAVNEAPWEPLPGMIKLRCERCDYWFATRPNEPYTICPICDPMAQGLFDKVTGHAGA